MTENGTTQDAIFFSIFYDKLKTPSIHPLFIFLPTVERQTLIQIH